jgi:YVTN family beta-propeller protein
MLPVLLSMLQLSVSGDVYPDSLTATVPTGMNPRGVCCHPDGGTVYLAIGYGFVPVISTVDWSLEAFIPAGESPSDLCILPSGDLVFVTDDSEGIVRVIDTSINAVMDSIIVPYASSRAIAVPPGDFVAVLHEAGHLTLIDAATLGVVGTYWAGNSPGGFCTLPEGGTVFVSDRNSSSAGAFDMSSRTLARFFVGGDTHEVCALPDLDLLYLNIRDWDMLAVVSVPDNTLAGEIHDIGTSPGRLCPLASGGYVYLADDQEDAVRIIRTSDQTVVGSVAVGSEPAGICSSPSGEMVFVANSGGSNMSVIGMSSTGLEGSPRPVPVRPGLIPDPCRGSAVLSVEMEAAGPVRVCVYSTDGRLLGTPVDGEFDAGAHEWALDALPSGLLFIVVESRDLRNVLPLVSI